MTTKKAAEEERKDKKYRDTSQADTDSYIFPVCSTLVNYQRLY